MKLRTLLWVNLLANDAFASFNQRLDKGTETACAFVSRSASIVRARSPFATPTVRAQVAYDCLNSVPLNASAAVALVEAILPYMEWQSDCGDLKQPPPTYVEPAIDIWASLDLILSNIKTGKYANEYAFQTDLFKTMNRVHDGHFQFVPDLLSKALSFQRPFKLVSVSMDGVNVPKVYSLDDIRAFNRGYSPDRPSAVWKIDGKNVGDYLEAWAQLGNLNDPDALYNSLFYEVNYEGPGSFASLGNGNIYPGPNTTIAFENRTIITFPNLATVVGDFSGVLDGESLYQKFCTEHATNNLPTRAAFDLAVPVMQDGYPTPLATNFDQRVLGYFLDGDSAYGDLAVVSISSFYRDSPRDFQEVIQNLMKKVKEGGKTKLVIDLSSNGGGLIPAGYDIFRQLFPNIVPDGFLRFREHEAFNVLSRSGTVPSESFLNYRSSRNVNLENQKFVTYEDKFAPQEFNGDNFTQIIRWNFYRDPKSFTVPFTQYFAAEDIIMVYKWYCASTCAVFSDFMRVQAGVRSIAMGGRPNKDPIQAVGGTRGALVLQYGFILDLVERALSSKSASQNLTALAAYNSLPQDRSTRATVNAADIILPNHLEDGVPAQFLYEEADCRLFYEPAMISDVRAVWKTAAEVVWGGGKCVAGSLKQKNAGLAARKRKSKESSIGARSEQRVSLETISPFSLWNERPSDPDLGMDVPP